MSVYLRSLPNGAMTSLMLKYSAAFQYAACAEGPTTISGAVMPLCWTMKSREALTASRMLSVPPGVCGGSVHNTAAARGYARTAQSRATAARPQTATRVQHGKRIGLGAGAPKADRRHRRRP